MRFIRRALVTDRYVGDIVHDGTSHVVRLSHVTDAGRLSRTLCTELKVR